MLTIDRLGFAMAGRPLFDAASARLPQKARVGLVGRNGAGKTTLFRLIQGALSPDAGDIHVPPRARLGGVAQEAPGDDRSLLDTVLAADTERAALMAEAETAEDPDRIAEIQTRLIDIDAHSAEARAAAILAGLGFDAAAQARPTAEFSGGWRMRVALAAVLFSAPDLLLLDEPTNYLDLEGSVWLEHYLARYPHGLMLISHDRGLLNRVPTHILHLHDRRLTLWTGNFDTFDRMRREKMAHEAAAAKKQEARRAHLQSYVDRFRYKADKARQAQARIKALARMEPIAVEADRPTAPIHFPDPDELAPPLMQVDAVDLGYDGRAVLSRIGFRLDQDDRVALLGANGQGKSTLAKLIAGKLAPMAGERRVSGKLRIGYFAQHQQDELVVSETPLDHLRRVRPTLAQGALRSVLANSGITAEIADTPVSSLSGGQKARLLLCLSALEAPHLMILDEPTNHLDMESREALVEALNAYKGAVILITHDPFLVDLVADRLWLVEAGRVRAWEGDMADYRAHILGGTTAATAKRAPTGGAPNGGAPSGGVPKGGVPKGGVPKGGVPKGGVPGGSAPNGSVPSGSAPSGGAPSGSAPSGSAPSGSAPSGSAPSGGVPGGGVPGGRAPNGRAIPAGATTERRDRAATRAAIAPLRAQLRDAEARLEKIADLLARVDEKLADPTLYDGPADRIAALNEKRADLLAAQEAAETAWLAAGERLEAATG